MSVISLVEDWRAGVGELEDMVGGGWWVVGCGLWVSGEEVTVMVERSGSDWKI